MADEMKRHALDNEFESGLPDDFDGKITDITFGYNDKIRDGEVALAIVTIESDEHDEPIEALYPCGNGWEVGGKPRGSAVVHESGKARRLNRNASWAQFAFHAYDAGFTDFGGDDVLSADTFVGLTFHWNRITVDYGGEIGKKERLYPTKLVAGKGGKKSAAKGADKGKGSSDEDAKPAKAAAKADKSAAKAGAGAKKPTKYDVTAVDDDLLAALVECAVDSADYDAFVEAALEIEGVDGDSAAEALVASKAFFDDNKSD